jgi:hypothetical protein
MEIEQSSEDAEECYRLNEEEIVILENLLEELYEKAERIE